ncbi:DUF2585 family protein [Lacipirellula sp.]|uniref:DUF2585 family protein n=1 Tax=Lacipirellula sp. TaxID=2691419 RepID=UPI003D09A68C
MTHPLIRRHWGALAVAAVAVAMVVAVRLEGRVWFCECNRLLFWVGDANSSHTSQHLLDPYSFTHFQHGLIFYWALAWLVPRWSWQGRLVAATMIEALWEIVENSEFVINRYREATAALGYTGDSVVNSLGDLLSCVIGFAIAGRIGWRWTLALFVGIEAGLLLWIRDSLLLNVLMLFRPVEAIKNWQLGQ